MNTTSDELKRETIKAEWPQVLVDKDQVLRLDHVERIERIDTKDGGGCRAHTIGGDAVRIPYSFEDVMRILGLPPGSWVEEEESIAVVRRRMWQLVKECAETNANHLLDVEAAEQRGRREAAANHREEIEELRKVHAKDRKALMNRVAQQFAEIARLGGVASTDSLALQDPAWVEDAVRNVRETQAMAAELSRFSVWLHQAAPRLFDGEADTPSEELQAAVEALIGEAKKAEADEKLERVRLNAATAFVRVRAETIAEELGKLLETFDLGSEHNDRAQSLVGTAWEMIEGLRNVRAAGHGELAAYFPGDDEDRE